MAVVQATGGREVPAMLAERPEDPTAMMWLWDAFQEIGRDRAYGGMTGLPEPIRFASVLSWQQLTGRTLSRQAVKIILMLDLMYLAVRTEERE